MKLVLPRLRGFCAGVDRAIEIVERALVLYGKPLYVRKEIIHNGYVVDGLRRKGVVFVESLDEVPSGQRVIFSAHGVAPAEWRRAEERSLRVIDATCPLVTKVHKEALHFSRRGHTLLLVGHASHDETIGTRGEAPEVTLVVETAADAERVQVPDPSKVAVLTQTTLSLDDTREIMAVLRRRFPALSLPPKDDICYATTNRQNAVKALAARVDVVFVIGAPNSSNSVRMAEVAAAAGVPAHLIETAADIRPEWLAGVAAAGVTSSASAPELLVTEVVALFRDRYGVTEVEEFETVDEDVHFPLPSELLQPTA